jgi:lipopolysaccharide transport system permease protein
MTAKKGQPPAIRVLSAANRSSGDLINPLKLLGNLWTHRQLILQFSKREVLKRYKGSYLGLLWSFINPVFMLLIYAFVFGVILRTRWSTGISDNSFAGFALTLFTGLIIFNVFSECVTAAPGLIVNNPNYVKRIIFPLEILPVSMLGSALLHSLVSLFVLFLGLILFKVNIYWTVMLFPLVYVPLIFLCLGMGWILSALGVFVRDIGQLVTIIVQMLFFMTPIFYPLDSIPLKFKFIFNINPMTFIVNQFRQVILWQRLPSLKEYLVLLSVTMIICLAGYLWFMKSKKAFADVL